MFHFFASAGARVWVVWTYSNIKLKLINLTILVFNYFTAHLTMNLLRHLKEQLILYRRLRGVVVSATDLQPSGPRVEHRHWQMNKNVFCINWNSLRKPPDVHPTLLSCQVQGLRFKQDGTTSHSAGKKMNLLWCRAGRIRQL